MDRFKKIKKELWGLILAASVASGGLFFTKSALETQLMLQQKQLRKELRKSQETEFFRHFCQKNEPFLRHLLAQKQKNQSLTFEALGDRLKILGKKAGLQNLALSCSEPSKKIGGKTQKRLELVFEAPHEKACLFFIQGCWEEFPGSLLPQKLVLTPLGIDKEASISGRYLLNFENASFSGGSS